MSASEEMKVEEKAAAVEENKGQVAVDVGVAAAASSSGDPERDKALANSSITNSEEPKLIKARIFVGNLPSDLRTEKGHIYDKFRKHGRIMGVSIHSRFAFVQFENESDARAAVKEENQTDFRTAKIEIKMAIEGRAINRNRGDDRERRRSRSPVERRRFDSREKDRDRRDSRDRYASRDSFRDRRRTRTPSPPYIPSPVEDRFCNPRTFGPNDVELVVIRKQQGQYAESILRRLYECRISANMLFLAEHADLNGAVNEFGRCGSHYVVIIMPKHEDTRAMTINMFEGSDKPREYRNLNVDEGISLISRHFTEHFPALARLRAAEIQGPNFYPAAPVEVARSLQRLAELSAVPTSSLDATIKYLQEMRERTAAFEGLSTAPSVTGGLFPAIAAAPMDTGLGKQYAGMLAAAANNEADPNRDLILGLLKASAGAVLGGGGGQAVQQMTSPTTTYPTTGGYPGYAAYPTSSGTSYSTAASQAALASAGLAGLASSDPAALQKALASFAVLGGGANQASSTQQQNQQQTQREPQMSAYQRSNGGMMDTEMKENGTGGYQSMSHQQSAGQQQVQSGAGQYGQQQHTYGQQQNGGGGGSGGLTQQQLAMSMSVAREHAAQMTQGTGRGAQVGQGGMSSSNGLQNAGQGSSMYGSTGAGLTGYPTQQQLQQRTMQAQQQSGYSSVSRR